MSDFSSGASKYVATVPAGMFGRGRSAPPAMSGAVNWVTGEITVADDPLAQRKLAVELGTRCSGPLDGRLTREDHKMIARLFFVDDPITRENAWVHARHLCLNGASYTLEHALRDVAPQVVVANCPTTHTILRALKRAGDLAIERGVHDILSVDPSGWSATNTGWNTRHGKDG